MVRERGGGGDEKPSKRLQAHAAFVQKSILQPSCPLPLSGSREDICFLHPSSLIRKATSVSLHSALPQSSSALLFQLKPPRHAVGAWAGAVIIMEVGMECPLFQCSVAALCLTQGWSPLVRTTVATASYAGPGSG